MKNVQTLLCENAALKVRIIQLDKEVAFLKLHPVFAQGLKGEKLVAKICGGSLTAFASSHDVIVGSEIKVEVKFSKLNRPTSGEIRRWNWSKPLGWKDKGKDFDFLLLVGDKDLRFIEQYPDDSPYVYFLIPFMGVADILTSGTAIGSNVQINTNLATAKSFASIAIKKRMVSAVVIDELLSQAVTTKIGTSVRLGDGAPLIDS